MKILNIYSSCTGNTKKVAQQIEKAAKIQNFEVETVEVSNDFDENNLNFLDYDFVFIGSGVYSWLPPTQMIKFIEKHNKKHSKLGDIKMSSPRIQGKKAVAYCTYGGPHTGVNEGLIAPKFLAQLFDHLGFEIVAEWYFEGAFNLEGYTQYSKGGRLGDISGRPNKEDLKKISGLVEGILLV